MRSPGSVRVAAERALRAGSLAVVAWMLVASLARTTAGAGERAAVGAALDDSLVSWSAEPGVAAVRAALEVPPSPAQRAWLAALHAAGVSVRWTIPRVPAAALAVEPAGAPDGAVRVLVAAPRGSRAAIADVVSPIDTLALDAPAASLGAGAVHGVVRVAVPGGGAAASRGDSLAPRAVLVLGRAGWEARFAIDALSSLGWDVRAELEVAPGVRVRRGAGGAGLDTATVAAVVVVDSTGARDAARITRFVRAGGGLVLVGEGAATRALAALAPARAGARLPAASLSFTTDAPRRALALRPLRALARDAVPLERRDGAVAVAARRAGAGRVVQVGYEDLWRWRMSGGADAPAAYAAWWSRLVASAAYRPAIPLAPLPGADPAPYAAAVAALGPPDTATPATPARAAAASLDPWLLLALLAMLLTEWASRRLRGAP